MEELQMQPKPRDASRDVNAGVTGCNKLPTTSVGCAPSPQSSVTSTPARERVKMKRTTGDGTALIDYPPRKSVLGPLFYQHLRPVLASTPDRKQSPGTTGSPVIQQSPFREPSPAHVIGDLSDSSSQKLESVTKRKETALNSEKRAYVADTKEDENYNKTKKRKGPTVTTPLINATPNRAYMIYRDADGRDQQAHGAIIPAGYIKLEEHGRDIWPCPVRNCDDQFFSLPNLGNHFISMHHSSTFNDNRDGTLTTLGTYGSGGQDTPGVVVSQEIRTEDPRQLNVKGSSPAIPIAKLPPATTVGPNSELKAPSASSNTAELETTAQAAESGDPGAFQSGFIQENSASQTRTPNIGQLFCLRSGEYARPGSVTEVPACAALESPAEDSTRTAVAGVAATRRPQETPVPIPVRLLGWKSVTKPPQTTTASVQSKAVPMVPAGASRQASDFTAPLPANPQMAWQFVSRFLHNPAHKKAVPTKQYVEEFLNLPWVRDLEWNVDWLLEHPWRDTVPRDISSLLMHMTGERASEPCDRCLRNNGPYIGCITIPKGLLPTTHSRISSCSNCLYHGNNSDCSLGPKLQEQFQKLYPDLNIKNAKGSVKATTTEDALSVPSSPAEEVPSASRSRGPPPNYNLKELVRTSIGSERRTKTRAATQETTNQAATETTLSTGSSKSEPVRQDIDPGGFDFAPRRNGLRSNRHSVTNLLEQAAPKVSPVPLPVQPWAKAPPRLEMTAKNLVDGSRQGPGLGTTAENLLDEKMEDWELAPGVLRGKADSGDIAFSNAYLNSQQAIAIADGISCRREFLKPGCSFTFQPEPVLRICWVGSGKIEVKQEDKTFSMGPGGVIKLRAEASAVVKNCRYMDACLQITAIAMME